MWGNRNEYVNMLFGNMSLYDFNILCLTDLTHQISCPFCYLSLQNWLAVFGDPDNVVL